MKTLLVNLKAYVLGFGKLSTLKYKNGWGMWRPKPFVLVYIFDHGTHVLTGAGIVSWSRWFYVHRKTNRVAAFLNRFLNHLDTDHGMMSGPVLFGTVDCSLPVRIGLGVFWVVLLWSLL